MLTGVEDLKAILAAYRQVKDASWPKLHPRMAQKHAHWPAPGSGVRVFWKLGAKYVFGGCNEHFAKDAGLKVDELLGTDDAEVFTKGTPKLDILERQTSGTGAVTWEIMFARNRAGKGDSA